VKAVYKYARRGGGLSYKNRYRLVAVSVGKHIQGATKKDYTNSRVRKAGTRGMGLRSKFWHRGGGKIAPGLAGRLGEGIWSYARKGQKGWTKQEG